MVKVGSWHFTVVLGIAIGAVLLLAGASGIPLNGSSPAQPPASSSQYDAPVMVGTIETGDITESSGLSASECQDVLWTHNDAGNAPLIFGMDLKGKHLGTWKVEGAQSVDWESIATPTTKYSCCQEKCVETSPF